VITVGGGGPVVAGSALDDLTSFSGKTSILRARPMQQWRNPMNPSPVTPFGLDDDDRPIGRVLSRRDVLAVLGLTSAAAFMAACAPAAVGTGSPAPSLAAGTGTPKAPTATAGPSASPSATATSTPTRTPAPTPTASGTLAPATPGATSVAIPACIVVPELTEGPYFVNEKLDRSDSGPTPRPARSAKAFRS